MTKTSHHARLEHLTFGHWNLFRASHFDFRASPDLCRARTAHQGFTLVEMLVVIGIIAVLAALLLPAVSIAIRTARNASIAVEINQLASAIESYKQDKGDYPPNFRDSNVVLRHIRKCYPKADSNYVTTVVTRACTQNANPDLFIDEGEALVFWLSMTDNDPRYPFLSYYNPNNQTPSPKKYYPFEEANFTHVPNQVTVQNIQGTFFETPAYEARFTKEMPYLYIDSRSYVDTCRFQNNTYNDSANTYAYAEDTAIGARPYWSGTAAPGASSQSPTRTRYKPMNATTFQLICAGQDGEFGGLANDVKVFPTDGTAMYGTEDKDNITNFSAGKTLGDSLP